MEVMLGHQEQGWWWGKTQMSNYVADKVRANRAGFKKLFQNPDGSSMCGVNPV